MIEYDPRTDTYHVRYDQSVSVSVAVMTAVSHITGKDLTQITPLYERLDPEALDTLFASKRRSSNTHVSFTIEDCRVTVRGNSEITIQLNGCDGSVSTSSY